MVWAVVTRPAITAALLCLCIGCTVQPSAYSTGELNAGAKYNLSVLTRGQEPVLEPISLYQAMARALKYNLELRVKDVQAQLADAKLNLSHYDLLPDIVANSGYASRDNLYASRSLNLATGAIDNSSSSSQDKQQYSQDLTFSWNVLDFGLSYIRAKQSADRYLIARELTRTTSHKLLEDVRTTYWKAQAYDRSLKRLDRLESRVKRAISNSRSLSHSHQISRMDSLVAERELIKIRRAIKLLQKDYNGSKTELAKLM
ncbi:MAG: TolC family protein, partial [Pseudomonadota bacterium]